MRIEYVTSTATLDRHLPHLLAQPVLGVDIETAGESKEVRLDPLQAEIRLFQAAALDGTTIVVDMRQVSWVALRPLCQVPWVAHNASFEWRHLTHRGLQLPLLHDSQLTDKLLVHTREPRSLEDVAIDVLDMQLDKTLQTSDFGVADLSREQIEYAAWDAVATVRIAQQQLPRVEKAGQGRLYRLWRDAVPVLGDLMLQGQSFDWDAHSQLLGDWQHEKETLAQQLQQYLGGINYNSTKQLHTWLDENLPGDVGKTWPKTATGNYSTSAATLALHAHLPMVQPLLRYKAVAKLVSTYGASWQKYRHPVTDRLHPEFRIGWTVSGRLATKRPNTQQPPRLTEFRQLFVPPPGQVLIGADFSQIELRVAALLSGDCAMLDVYRKGEDLHTTTAAAIAGCPIADVTPEQRQGAKPVNFGNLYGQAAAGLARQAKLDYGVDMTTADATQALLKFKLAYPMLDWWKRQQVAKAQQQRQVHTKLGMVRDFDAVPAGFLKGEAQNSPVQGSAAEVLLASLVRLPDALKGTDAVLYHTVHDEIELACSPDYADQAAAGLRDAMVAGFLDVFPEGADLTSDLVDVRIGNNWAAVH